MQCENCVGDLMLQDGEAVPNAVLEGKVAEIVFRKAAEAHPGEYLLYNVRQPLCRM